jgi:hypothetical protein
MIDQHAVTAVERSLGDRVEQAEGRHHSAGRQHFDLQIAAGHVVDDLGVVLRVFVEDVLRRPGALPAHGDRALRLHDARRQNDGARSGYTSAVQELAAAGNGFGLIGFHRFPPDLLLVNGVLRTPDSPP